MSGSLTLTAPPPHTLNQVRDQSFSPHGRPYRADQDPEYALSNRDVQKEVDVEDLRSQFTHNDLDLDKKFMRFAKGMIENAYREARDGKKFEQ